MAVPFGQSIGPFYGVVPIDGMNRVFGAFGNAGIGEGVSVSNGPRIDFIPEGFGYFVLVDGKSGQGDFMPGGSIGIIDPVDPSGDGGHFYGDHDGGTGHIAFGITDHHGIVPLICTGGILQG